METSLQGQTWVVTGATAGLGQATAEGLARLGATVVGLNRDRQKGEAARQALVQASGRDDHAAYVADLADQAAIRRAAAEIGARHPRLHGLINNAGLSLGQRQVTADGQEMTWAVNFLAPFLLTHLLLPALRAGATPDTPSQIINLATWKQPPIEFDDVRRERRFNAMAVYGESKTALVMFTQDLARRLTDVTVNAVNPGLVRTNIGTGLTGINWLFIKVIAPLTMMVPPEKGAGYVLRLATDPALKGVTGQFFYEAQPKPPFEAEPTPADRERLWQMAEAATGLAGVTAK